VSSFLTLKSRSEFLKAARAAKVVMPGLLLQARHRDAEETAVADVIRVGFTCSKKVGNAVTRNRAKRRLRAAARAQIPQLGRAGWDYVLIGRADATTNRAFTDLSQDLAMALTRIHRGQA
jgi:ribonuclease P protein component